ncbi:MAG: DUF1800 domain-containing protein [Pseudomonadota bacterium]
MAVRAETLAAIRFGYGLHPDQPAPDGADALLSHVARGTTAPIVPAPNDLTWRRKMLARLRTLNKDVKSLEKRATIRKEAAQDTVVDLGRLLVNRAVSPNGFFERLVSFWADHFTVGVRSPLQRVMMADFEISALRPHIGGNFADLAISVTQHPAMIVYLDQQSSMGPNSPRGKRTGKGLNENLARELLELHTLGVDGSYTQADVRATAEVLTGYAVSIKDAGFRFAEQMSEPGAHNVMGRSYGGAPSHTHAETLIRDLAVHPQTARHIAEKLAIHFVSDTPDSGLVRHIEQAWLSSGGALPAVYAALVEHPASWRGFGDKVKRPSDLVVSTLRASGLSAPEAKKLHPRELRRIVQAVRRLGQPMLRPPSPAGWPEEGSAWITPQGLAQRVSYAKRAAELIAQRGADPRSFAETTLADALGGETAFAVSAAPEQWQGIALVIASPEFNRR